MKKKQIEYYVDDRGCYICTSHSIVKGYPYVYANGRWGSLVRHLWTEQYGEIPKGLCTLHSCDNPVCINLDHIRLGTHADNMKDMVIRNRSKSSGVKGEDISKLKESDVQYIIAHHTEYKQRELGKMFGVTQANISAIVVGKSWRHITGRCWNHE